MENMEMTYEQRHAREYEKVSLTGADLLRSGGFSL